MTKQELLDAADVMAKAANGAKVQLRERAYSVTWSSADTKSLEWRWDRFDYRIATEKKKVPLTMEDFMGGARFLHWKALKSVFTVLSAGIGGVCVINGNGESMPSGCTLYTYQELMSAECSISTTARLADAVPCWKEVEE